MSDRSRSCHAGLPRGGRRTAARVSGQARRDVADRPHDRGRIPASRDLGRRGVSAEPSTTPPGGQSTLRARSGCRRGLPTDCLAPASRESVRGGEASDVEGGVAGGSSRAARRWRLVAGRARRGWRCRRRGNVGENGGPRPAARFPPDMTHRHGRCGPARPMPGSPAAKPLRSPQACSAALALGRTDPDLAAPASASTVPAADTITVRNRGQQSRPGDGLARARPCIP